MTGDRVRRTASFDSRSVQYSTFGTEARDAHTLAHNVTRFLVHDLRYRSCSARSEATSEAHVFDVVRIIAHTCVLGVLWPPGNSMQPSSEKTSLGVFQTDQTRTPATSLCLRPPLWM